DVPASAMRPIVTTPSATWMRRVIIPLPISLIYGLPVPIYRQAVCEQRFTALRSSNGPRQAIG
ncbi:hypothetical protein, partial [Candidatus Entotheonella palauensis]|uniref:hypothetical protein n=1 Tax=Candidatus Entotheonella palauensis TaxID=93172 RepID=UPI001C4E1DF9